MIFFFSFSTKVIKDKNNCEILGGKLPIFHKVLWKFH